MEPGTEFSDRSPASEFERTEVPVLRLSGTSLAVVIGRVGLGDAADVLARESGDRRDADLLRPGREGSEDRVPFLAASGCELGRDALPARADRPEALLIRGVVHGVQRRPLVQAYQVVIDRRPTMCAYLVAVLHAYSVGYQSAFDQRERWSEREETPVPAPREMRTAVGQVQV